MAQAFSPGTSLASISEGRVPLSERRQTSGPKSRGARTSRLVRASLLVAAALATGYWALGLITPSLRGLAHNLLRSRPEARLAAREALLLRQIQGVDTLVARAERGPLVPLSDEHAVVIVDRALVRSLLRALIPADYVIADRYRVRVTDAAVEFEDGFALV